MGHPPPHPGMRRLLAEAQFLDDRAIAIDLGGLQVVEQATPLAHHTEETATGVVIGL